MWNEGGAKILVVDDEASIREVLTDFLTMEGFEVASVADGYQAVAALQAQPYEVVLLDLKMPGMDGLTLLDEVRRLRPRAIPIMMTGFGTVETAISAMKRGAYDYVLKPFKVQNVIHLVGRALQKQKLEEENIQLREALSIYHISEEMARTLSLRRVLDLLVETARQEVDPDAVLVYRRREAGQPFEVARRWTRSDLDPEQLEVVSSLVPGALHERAEAGGALIVRGTEALKLLSVDASTQEQVAQALRPSVGLMAVPLRTRNETLGYLVSFAFEPRRPLSEGKRKMLAVLCGRASAALENARLYEDLQDTFKQTIQALANLLEDKDPYTRGHSERVARYGRMIALGLGLSEAEVAAVVDGGLIHDIGKLGIRHEDLNKAEPLTEDEYEMFKSHTTRGKWILEPIPFLHHLIPAVYHHHERWDGKGYPLGLAGEDIPLMARILAIADTYDAMTSHRAYRRALPHDVAIREIEAFAGTQFDPRLVRAFVEAIHSGDGGGDGSGRPGQGSSKAQRWNALKEWRRPEKKKEQSGAAAAPDPDGEGGGGGGEEESEAAVGG